MNKKCILCKNLFYTIYGKSDICPICKNIERNERIRDIRQFTKRKKLIDTEGFNFIT